MKNMMLNILNTENFANLCKILAYGEGVYGVSGEALRDFFELETPTKGEWYACPLEGAYTRGVHVYHCDKYEEPDGHNYDFWFPRGWYWEMGIPVEYYGWMDDDDFCEILRSNTPWTTEMFKEIYRRGDALSDWERGGNLNDYEEQEFLDSLLVKLGAPDLATFTRY